MAVSLPNLVQAVSGAFPFTAGLNLAMNAERVINDSKVTDHHALLPTKSMPHSDLMALPAGERDILTLVAVRLLCAVGDDYVYDETTATLECENVTFTGKGKTVVQMGWKNQPTTSGKGLSHSCAGGRPDAFARYDQAEGRKNNTAQAPHRG